MGTLLSKLQYRNYEPGEFTDAEERPLDEVIQLIKSFPWEEQRHFTPVGPTCPSVTLEDKAGNYLKFGHHYYEKYCLYLLTANGKLLKKVMPTLEDGLQAVSAFFNGADIEQGFEHEFALHPQRHFITKEFVYHIGYAGILISTVMYSIPPLILFGLLSLSLLGRNASDTNAALFTGLMFFCAAVAMVSLYFAVQCWRVFLNHYRYSKKQLLKISKGHNEFVFSDGDSSVTYFKDGITTVREYRNTQSRNPWAAITVTELTFDNGEQIRLSSMLLKHSYVKFPGVKWESVSKFLPLIR